MNSFNRALCSFLYLDEMEAGVLLQCADQSIQQVHRSIL